MTSKLLIHRFVLMLSMNVWTTHTSIHGDKLVPCMNRDLVHSGVEFAEDSYEYKRTILLEVQI